MLHQTRYSVAILCVCLLAILGCGPNAEVEKAKTAFANLGKEVKKIADALESVKDEASAKSAAETILSSNKRLDQHIDELTAAGDVRISSRDEDELEAQMKVMDGDFERLNSALITAVVKSDGEETLQTAIEELQKTMEKMATVF
jgi:outer membrane murein-binding lipoprotein Lpp